MTTDAIATPLTECASCGVQHDPAAGCVSYALRVRQAKRRAEEAEGKVRRLEERLRGDRIPPLEARIRALESKLETTRHDLEAKHELHARTDALLTASAERSTALTAEVERLRALGRSARESARQLYEQLDYGLRLTPEDLGAMRRLTETTVDELLGTPDPRCLTREEQRSAAVRESILDPPPASIEMVMDALGYTERARSVCLARERLSPTPRYDEAGEMAALSGAEHTAAEDRPSCVCPTSNDPAGPRYWDCPRHGARARTA